MDLRDAANFFSDAPVHDAYTGALLFYCHATPHDDHTSSGATTRRRTMTTAIGTTAPARGVVTLYGDPWLMGNGNNDGFQDVLIRRNYGLKKSSGLMTVLTPAQACMGQVGVDFHAHKEYFRDTQDAKTSADLDTMWTIFCPPAEPVAKGGFLRQSGTLFRVHNCYLDQVEGLTVAEADQLDADAAQTITFTASTLDLVADVRSSAAVPVLAIQTDLQKFYLFRTLAESAVQPGDRTVFIAKSSYMPTVGCEFTMLGARWTARTVVSELDAWVLQARLA